MMILSIDPGTENCGWAVLSHPEVGGDAELIEYGTFTTRHCTDHYMKRHLILHHCLDTIRQFGCDAAVIEDYTVESVHLPQGRVTYPFTASTTGTGKRAYLHAHNAWDMCRLMGALEHLPVPVHLVRPLTWMQGLTGIRRGKIDKLTRATIIQARLGTIKEYRTRDDGNHATDACGVGLWWLDHWFMEKQQGQARKA